MVPPVKRLQPWVNRLQLWVRELRRASWLATDSLTGGLLWPVACSVVGAVFGVYLSPDAGPKSVQAIYAAAGAAVPILLFGLLVGFQLRRYRKRGFTDPDWIADYDDSGPNILFPFLRGRPDSPPISTVVLECWVGDGDGWTIIKNDDQHWLRKGNVAWYPFHTMHGLKPGSIYEVRWFERGRGRAFAEITREAFRLRTHAQTSLSRPPGSASG